MNVTTANRRTDHIIELTIAKDFIEINNSHPKQISLKMQITTAQAVAEVLVGALPTLEPFEKI